MGIPSSLSSKDAESEFKSYLKVFTDVAKAADKEEQRTLNEALKSLTAMRVELKKLLEAVENGITDDGLRRLNSSTKPKTAAEAESMLLELERGFPNAAERIEKGKDTGKRIAELCKSIKDTADEFKSDRKLMDAASALLKRLPALAKEGRNFIEFTAQDYGARTEELRRLQTRLKDIESEQDDSLNAGSSGERAKRVSKTRTALKELRTAPPDRTVPMYVMVKGSELFVYVARDATTGQVETLKKEVFGGPVDKVHFGSVKYVDRRYMFVSSSLGGGSWTQRIQKFLQVEIGQRLPLGVSNDKELLEPALTGDDFKDPIDYVISELPPLRDKARRLKARRDDLIRKLDSTGALKRDNSYSLMLDRTLIRFDDCFKEDAIDLAKADKMLDLIETDILDAVKKSRMDAQNHLRLYLADRDKYLPQAEKIQKSGLDDLKREVDKIYEKYNLKYGRERDAPGRFPKFNEILKRIEETQRELKPIAEAAREAENDSAYTNEWVLARNVLLKFGLAIEAWNEAFRDELSAAKEKAKATSEEPKETEKKK